MEDRSMRWLFLGAVVVIGIPAYFGLIDIGGSHSDKAGNPAVAEDPSCPGYKMIRRFKEDGAISDYKPVAAGKGWDCEYTVNDGVGDVQFRKTSTQVELSFLAGGSTSTKESDDLETRLLDEMHQIGFDE
jgi:hypothetical protein